MLLYPENKGNPYIDMVEFCVNEMPNWNAFYVNPPFPLPRIKSQRDTPWSLALNTFSKEQSLEHTYWFSVEGLERLQILRTFQ